MPAVLTRWEPFAELGELHSRLDRMLGEHSRERAWTPAIDIVRDHGSLLVRADIPGINPEDVKVEVEDDILTISGEHEETTEEKKKDYVRRERRYGTFSRSLALPPGIDAKSIEAKTRNGVVEVTIPFPKAPEKRKIEIKPTAA